jgi:hypothetical protein
MKKNFFRPAVSGRFPNTIYNIHIQFPYMEATHTISYNPGDSTSEIFGGNSNWRGPVWIPINFLIVESLARLQMNSPKE